MKFRRIKYVLISNKIDFSKQIVYVSLKLLPKCGAWRQDGGGWETIARGAETVSRGLEVILRIRRLWRSFCGAHGGPRHPPSWSTVRVFFKFLSDNAERFSVNKDVRVPVY